MALNGAIQWEVRTTGNAANGGGFKAGATGTDYSQQDDAQYNLTTATTAGANAIILDASAAAVMVGNVLQIISGTNFTPGFYEITSVSVGVSITVDRNCATGAGALGVINIGGAVDHPNTISTVVVGSNLIYIKSGTYSAVGANDYVLSIITSDSVWIGYSTTRTRLNNDATRTYLDGGGAVANAILGGGNYDGIKIYNLVAQHATGVGYLGNALSTNDEIFNCKFHGNGSHGLSGFGGVSVFNCEADGNTGAGFSQSGNYIGCYSHNNTSYGFQNGSFDTCISESNESHGFVFGHTTRICRNIAYNNTGTTDGFQFNANYDASLCWVFNNISFSNGRYGFNTASGGAITYFDYNDYNGNGTSGLNGIPTETTGVYNLTSDPLFTDPANGDFTLQAGSPCLNVGFPQTPMAGATI